MSAVMTQQSQFAPELVKHCLHKTVAVTKEDSEIFEMMLRDLCHPYILSTTMLSGQLMVVHYVGSAYTFVGRQQQIRKKWVWYTGCSITWLDTGRVMKMCSA